MDTEALALISKTCLRCKKHVMARGHMKKYCDECRAEIQRAAIRDWKKRDKARRADERARETISCATCGAISFKTSSRHKFCRPCRTERDRKAQRESTRKARATPEAKEAAKVRMRERRAKNPKYAISARMSAAVYQALKGGKAGRGWESLVGYTLADLVEHLERQFRPGMSWANYGRWQIDHIRPISSFSFADAESDEFRDCWSLTNLQPLWAVENASKNNRRLLLI